MAGWGSQRAHTLRPPGPGASKRSRSIPAFWEPSLLLLAENEGGSCYPDDAGPALRRGSRPVRVCPKIVGQLLAVVLPGGQARQNRDTPACPSFITLGLHPKLYEGLRRCLRIPVVALGFSPRPEDRPRGSPTDPCPGGRSLRGVSRMKACRLAIRRLPACPLS
jgi:hypothetical protein